MNRIISHSCLMLKKNIKNYMALSITIVISFIILLGYYLIVDSNIYNEYKGLFSVPSNVVLIDGVSSSKDIVNLEKVLEANEIEFKSFSFDSLVAQQYQYDNVLANIKFLPNNMSQYFEQGYLESSGDAIVKELKMLKGKNNFSLKENEAIINESFFNALDGGNKELPFKLDVLVKQEDGKKIVLNLNVVGICEDGDYIKKLDKDENGKMIGDFHVYVPKNLEEKIDLSKIAQKDYSSLILSKKSNEIDSYATKLQLNNCCVKEIQRLAKNKIAIEKRTKMIISLIILLVLSVNMFGCLTNVISKRQYEIGVKRAIGASRFDILIQFFLESVSVLCIDLILSIFLVANIGIIYKVIYWMCNKKIFVLYLSKYSMFSFGIASVMITILLSLVLAYLATNVDIVEQLRSE